MAKLLVAYLRLVPAFNHSCAAPGTLVVKSQWGMLRFIMTRSIHESALHSKCSDVQAQSRNRPNLECGRLDGVQDQSGRSLWDFTWHKAKTVSSGLTPQLLTASGLHFEQPPAPEPAPTPEQPRTEDGYPATVMALAQANSQHIMASPRSEPEQRPFGQDPAAIASPSHSELHSRVGPSSAQCI